MNNPHITKVNKYIAVAATTKKVTEDWAGTSQLTDEAITQLAVSAIGKPVLLGFDEERQVGKIISGKNDNGRLVVEFSVTERVTIDKLHRTIKQAESISYGLTHHPIEQDLPEIEKI